MTVKKKRKSSKAAPVRRRRRRSRKRKPSATPDHALQFVMHYDPVKVQPYIPPRTDNYGVVDNLFQPITAEELEFQRKFRRRR